MFKIGDKIKPKKSILDNFHLDYTSKEKENYWNELNSESYFISSIPTSEDDSGYIDIDDSNGTRFTYFVNRPGNRFLRDWEKVN